MALTPGKTRITEKQLCLDNKCFKTLYEAKIFYYEVYDNERLSKLQAIELAPTPLKLHSY